MKRHCHIGVHAFAVLLALIIFTLITSAAAAPQPPLPEEIRIVPLRGAWTGAAFAPGRILVRFEDWVKVDAARRLLDQHGLTVVGRIEQISVQILAVPEGQELTLVEQLQADPRLLYAEPDYIYQAFITPNDTYYAEYQWNMRQIDAAAAVGAARPGTATPTPTHTPTATPTATVAPARIHGMVWEDQDRDGAQDMGEPAIARALIALRTSDFTVVASRTTGPSGQFGFSPVEPGVYLVEETDPPGYGSSTSNVLRVTVYPSGAHWVKFGDHNIPTPTPTETRTPTATPTPSAWVYLPLVMRECGLAHLPTPTPVPPTPTPELPRAVRFGGVIRSIEGDIWLIDGQRVLVTGETSIDDRAGEAIVGAKVWVHAEWSAGVLVAISIKVEEPAAERKNINGLITSIQGEVWTIGGSAYSIPSETVSGDSPQVGCLARVALDEYPDGSVVIVSVVVECQHPVQFGGVIGSIAGNRWQIGGTTVIEGEGTVVEGVPEIGRWAEVEGNQQADGSVLATHIRVLEPTATPTKTPTATDTPTATATPTHTAAASHTPSPLTLYLPLLMRLG